MSPFDSPDFNASGIPDVQMFQIEGRCPMCASSGYRYIALGTAQRRNDDWVVLDLTCKVCGCEWDVLLAIPVGTATGIALNAREYKGGNEYGRNMPFTSREVEMFKLERRNPTASPNFFGVDVGVEAAFPTDLDLRIMLKQLGVDEDEDKPNG